MQLFPLLAQAADDTTTTNGNDAGHGLIVSVIIWIVIGIVAGFLASKIVNKSGEGLIRDLILGLVGSFVGGLIMSLVGIHAGGFIGSIVVATIGRSWCW